MFEWFNFKIQISRFSLYWPIRGFRFNLIREISAWKITDAIAAGYCFSACFLAGPLLKKVYFISNSASLQPFVWSVILSQFSQSISQSTNQLTNHLIAWVSGLPKGIEERRFIFPFSPPETPDTQANHLIKPRTQQAFISSMMFTQCIPD